MVPGCLLQFTVSILHTTNRQCLGLAKCALLALILTILYLEQTQSREKKVTFSSLMHYHVLVLVSFVRKKNNNRVLAKPRKTWKRQVIAW